MGESYIFFDKETAFEGEISTDHLILEGVITGDVSAAKDVFLKQGSVVEGEIATKKYQVEEGAVHRGKVRMDSHQESPSRIDPEKPGRSKSLNGNGKAGNKKAFQYDKIETIRKADIAQKPHEILHNVRKALIEVEISDSEKKGQESSEESDSDRLW